MNKRVFATIFMIVTCLPGCGSDGDGGWSPFLSEDGTGVHGLDTPEQILSNPYVEDALNDASEEGVEISPEHGVDPPVISGTYSISGEALHPIFGWLPLAPGTWRWQNQTSENYIDTEFEQIGMQSGSGGGEIIRGSGNRFTVYSILEISDTEAGGCEERMVVIVDGEQDNEGNVTAVYIATPAQNPVCHGVSIGRLELTLSRGHEHEVKAEVGSALLRLLSNVN